MDKPLPILVIGAGRGGTSLLAACMSGHAQIDMQLEFGGVALLMGRELQVGDPRRMLAERLAAFRAARDAQRAASALPIWGNKITTEHIFGLGVHNHANKSAINVAERLAEAMDGYRFVFITREGRACIASKMNRTNMNIGDATGLWRYSIYVFRTLKEMGRLSTSVRFEDLVTSPESTLREVCAAVGLDFDPNMLKQTMNSQLHPGYRQAGFLPEKAKVPEGLQSVLSEIWPELNYCGYV